MKKIITLVCLVLCLTALSQTSTTYSPGFTYTYKDAHYKLLEWKQVNEPQNPTRYMWYVEGEVAGIIFRTYTDDCWIDLYTNKCWFDYYHQKFVYYERHDNQ